MYKYVRYTIRTAFFIISNIYALPCYMVWMTLLTPLRILMPSFYWKIEAFVFQMLQCMVVTWLSSGGYKIKECGDDISLLQDNEAIILCNHQSTADTPIIMLASRNKGMAAGNTMWIMYILFKYTNFGLISWHREDFFIDQGRNVRDLQLTRLKEHLIKSYLPHKRKWIIVFPEGGFLRKRLESSQNFARKNGFPVLQHVTLPRIGAMKTILDTVGEPYEQPRSPLEDSTDTNSRQQEPESDFEDSQHAPKLADSLHPLKWVVDITLAYKDRRPLDMVGMIVGYSPKNDILLHYRAYRAKDIPRDEEGLTQWLYNRYIEKEKILDHYYNQGELSQEVLNEQRLLPHLEMSYLKFDLIEQILIHLFCAASLCIHFIYITKPLVISIFYSLVNLF